MYNLIEGGMPDVAPTGLAALDLFETLGGVGPATWKFIRELGAYITSQLKDAKQTLFLRQRLSVAIHNIGGADFYQKICRLL